MRLPQLAAVVAVALALSSPNARAQSESAFPAHDRSSSTEGARYEVVQANYAARFTFLADRFGGSVFLLVEKADSSGFRWQPIPDPTHQPQEQVNLGRVNYQLFVSGLSARNIFLVNVNDGYTWSLFMDTRGNYFWKVVN